jgi:hypothetical protein
MIIFKKNMKRICIFSLLFVFILIISGCTYPWQSILLCSEDLKSCPNGSFVGRIGPNCEFAPCPKIPTNLNQQPITNFEECAAAGNPVMESYPRQCRANGQTFVEEISDADKDKLQPPPESEISSTKVCPLALHCLG